MYKNKKYLELNPKHYNTVSKGESYTNKDLLIDIAGPLQCIRD